MGEYLLILYTLSPLTSPGTCPSSWSSGGGACCADFQVLAVGGAAVPLPGAGLSGGCLPREAAGGTAPVAGQLWKPGFSSGRNSVCRAWRLRGGAADLLSWGRSVLAVLGPPGLCLSRGEAGSWAVSRRPVLRGLRCWIRAPGPRNPLRGAAARAPLSCSGSSRGPCSLLGSSAAGYGAVSWVRRCLSVLGSPRASLSSWRPAPSPCGCLSTQEDW